MTQSPDLARQQDAAAAEAGSPPLAGCGDAPIHRQPQSERKASRPKADGALKPPNPGTSWEGHSEMTEAERDRKAQR